MKNPGTVGYKVRVCVWGLALLTRSGEACYGSPTCAQAVYAPQYAASQYNYAPPQQPVYQAYQAGVVPEGTEDPKPTAWENFLTKHGKELIHITANTILQAGETIASVKKEKAHAATAVAGINLKCFQTSMGYRDSDGKVCTGPVNHRGSEHNAFSSSADHSSMSTSRRASRSASSTMSSSTRTSRSVSSTRSSSSRSNDSRGNREGSRESNSRRSHSGGASFDFPKQFSSSRRSGEKASKSSKTSSSSRSYDEAEFSPPKFFAGARSTGNK